jgi:hypothetical protein
MSFSRLTMFQVVDYTITYVDKVAQSQHFSRVGGFRQWAFV